MKKFFSFFLCVSIIISLFSITANAVEPEIVVEFCGSEYFDYSKTEDVFSEKVTSYYYKASTKNHNYSSHSILNDLEKVYYDAVVNINPGTLSFKITYSPLLSAEEYNSIDFKKIMNAIVLDNPDLFYYAGYSCSRSYYPSTGEVASVTYNILCKTNAQTNKAIYNSTNIPIYSNAIKAAFDDIQVDTSNRYNFVKSVHDYLCESVDYVTDYGSAHDIYGALVNKQAVCEGYSEAFKLFCDYYKIPCVLITGTGNGGPHMWNAVQMDDGKWYLLDITWDDQTDTYWTFYDFFLVGLYTKDIYFGGSAFNVSHIPDVPSYLPLLDYATDKYTETNHNTAFKATYNSLAIDDGNFLIRSYFDIDETNVYYNGMYVETNNLTTNGVFKAPSGENYNQEDWTLVVLGDCNADGICNASDYSEAVNKVLADNGVSDASDMAADMDCDGCLDVIDLAVIQLATSGLNTDIEIE